MSDELFARIDRWDEFCAEQWKQKDPSIAICSTNTNRKRTVHLAGQKPRDLGHGWHIGYRHRYLFTWVARKFIAPISAVPFVRSSKLNSKLIASALSQEYIGIVNTCFHIHINSKYLWPTLLWFECTAFVFSFPSRTDFLLASKNITHYLLKLLQANTAMLFLLNTWRYCVTYKLYCDRTWHLRRMT